MRELAAQATSITTCRAELDRDLFLLGRCTPSPIGNLRVRSREALENTDGKAFAVRRWLTRSNDFLEYAYEAGAIRWARGPVLRRSTKLLVAEGLMDEVFMLDAMLSDSLVESALAG